MPVFNGRIQQVITPAVQIEINWNGIFTDNVTPGATRLEVADLLCRAGSTQCLSPFVKAVEEIVTCAGAAGPANPVQQILMKRVHHIVIQATAADAPPKTRPTLTLQPSATGVGETLIYSVTFSSGARGCLAAHEAKDQLRALLGGAYDAPGSI